MTRLNHRYWWLFSSMFLLLVTVASLWPADQLPELPGTDKTHHLLSYFVVMLPIAWRKPKYWPLMALCIVGWSGVIELIQPSVNRYGEWLDLLANSLGVLFACVVAWVQNKVHPSASEKSV